MSTPYMNLVLPVVGPSGTVGPDWANFINTCLTYIDAHDHSSNNGKKITPAGLNINQTLKMNHQQLSELASLAIDNLSSQPSSSNLIYEYAGELYFNDSSGNKVQITSGGAINVASLGTITGDYSTSSADLTYSDASKTFIFKQSASLTANVDCGPLKIYRNILSSPYARIQQSNSQAGNLDWTLPVAYPASKLPLKIDNSGVMTLEQLVTADIADLQVTAAKLAVDSVETAKIKNSAVTADKIATSVAGNGLVGGGGSALAVNPDNSTIEINSDALNVKALGITNVHIGGNASISRFKFSGFSFFETVAISSTSITSTSYITIASGSFSKINTSQTVFKFKWGSASTSNPSYAQCVSGFLDIKYNFFGFGDLHVQRVGTNSGTVASPVSSLDLEVDLTTSGITSIAWTVSAKVTIGSASFQNTVLSVCGI